MSPTLDLRGLIPAPVTPFTADLEVDHAAVASLARWLASIDGVKGLVCSATPARAPT